MKDCDYWYCFTVISYNKMLTYVEKNIFAKYFPVRDDE